MSKLITVIMAGGRGERLWPKSNNSLPKQFAKIVSNKSMLEETIDRCRIFSSPNHIYISTLKRNLPLLKKVVPRFPSRNLIVEPLIRDTACAILLASLSLSADNDDVIVFLPSDHYLKPVTKFKNDITAAYRHTQKTGKATLIGINPTSASTEYGYLKVKKRKPTENGKILTVEKFIEKPDLRKAQSYLRSKQYLWNSGIFMFNRGYLLDLFRQHTPQLFTSITRYLELMKTGKTTAALNIFKKIDKISFDYAIAEKITPISCVRSTFFWDDVGNWESLFRIKPTDNNGNIVISKDNCYLKDSHDNLCLIEDDRFVVLNGVKEMIIISKDDKIYIAHRKSASKIKSILKELENGKNKKNL